MDLSRSFPFIHDGSLTTRYQKGIRLIFLKRAVDFVVTLTSELGDVCNLVDIPEPRGGVSIGGNASVTGDGY